MDRGRIHHLFCSSSKWVQYPWSWFYSLDAKKMNKWQADEQSELNVHSLERIHWTFSFELAKLKVRSVRKVQTIGRSKWICSDGDHSHFHTEWNHDGYFKWTQCAHCSCEFTLFDLLLCKRFQITVFILGYHDARNPIYTIIIRFQIRKLTNQDKKPLTLLVTMGKLTAKYRYRVVKQTDARIRILNEIIQGIQTIKMYAWEQPFIKMINGIRK